MKSIKTTFLTPIAAIFCMTIAGNVIAESSTAEAYSSINILIHNSSNLDMPLTANIDCTLPSPETITFHDDTKITNAKILPGGAPGECTLTFSVSSENGTSVTILPITLQTESGNSKFTLINAEYTNTPTPISGSNGYQVTTSFDQNTMIATINKAT